jgi:hypothetical protein
MLTLLAPILKIAAITMGALLLAMAPVIVAGGALALVFFGLSRSESAVGSFADKVTLFLGKVKLGFTALVQFFKEGKISGAVADELLEAENVGVFRFVTGVARAAERIDKFIDEMIASFDRVVANSKPQIEAFEQSLDTLLEAVDKFIGIDSSEAQANFGSAGVAGDDMGRRIGGAFQLATEALTNFILLTALFLNAWDVVKGIFLTTWNSIMLIPRTAFGVIQSIVTFAFRMVTGLFNVFGGLLTGNWSRFWFGMKQVVFAFAQGSVELVLGMAQNIAKIIDSVTGGNIADRLGSTIKASNRALNEALGGGTAKPTAAPGGGTTAAPRTVFSRGAGGDIVATSIAAETATSQPQTDVSQAAQLRALETAIRERPLSVQVQLDGEQIAFAVGNQNGLAAETSFTPGGGGAG